MDKTVLAYLAGYLDGDGCITFPKLKNRDSVLTVKVHSGDKEVIETLSRVFGGAMHASKVYPETKRKQFYWYKSGGEAKKVLQKLFPYLIAKKNIAEKVRALTFGYGNGRPMPELEKLARVETQAAIHAFNTRITIND